ncbi:UNVERIFIED_CONTAM: hypothetical protein HDU68_009985 [Siphonaria sp. JEL0065]|nr:hypothetical protein HDU68_009985 [Siphonaria sp. JEL0065]
MDEGMKENGYSKKSGSTWNTNVNETTVSTVMQQQQGNEQEVEFDEDDENFIDDEEEEDGEFDNEGDMGNNQLGLNNVQQQQHQVHQLQPQLPPVAALPQPPAPLLRRDSGQSDDHDMNCLHFFAKWNGKAKYPVARKQFTHTHTEVITSINPAVSPETTTTRIGTTTQILLAPPLPSIHTPPVRSLQLDINARVKFHCLSPLHFAAMNASPDFISALIRNGANINSTDMHCRTPLRLATNTRRPEIVRLLLNYTECIDIPDAEGTTALRSAVFRSDVEMVRVFFQTRSRLAHLPLEGGSDGSDGDKSSGIHALHVCASFGNLEMIDMLVYEVGVSVDARDSLGRTPLMYAATKGKWEAVDHLLKLSSRSEGLDGGGGGDDGVMPVMNSVLERSEESAVTLVGEDELNGPIINNLIIGSEKKLKYNVKRADPNAQDGHGWTALHYAAVATKADPLKTIEILTAQGAFVDAKEFRYALTPLHMAAKSGHVHILNLLIAKGANPNHRTTDNRTCLCFSAYGSHLECIKALISSNPEVIRPTLPRKKRDIGTIEKVVRVILDIPFLVARFVWSITIGYRPSLQFDAALYEQVAASATLSPLHLAIRAKEQSQEVIDMLLNAGADINAGIPIEVGSDWFSFCKRAFKTVTFTSYRAHNGNSEAINPDDEDDKIFYVNPVTFALAFGNAEVALKLLKHRTQYCLASLLQGMTILMLSLFMMRFDVAWRALLKTPAGIMLEMSGLDLTKDKILEIACIITDGDLNIIAESPDLIIRTEKSLLDSMDEWCVQHHGQSGLTQSAIDSKQSMQDVESQILTFIKKYIPEKNVGVLAGNSVHMDKEFLRKDMPTLLGHLHYRLVDVSTIKELMARWNPELLTKAPKKKGSHRALDDIKESVEELKYYRQTAFKF